MASELHKTKSFTYHFWHSPLSISVVSTLHCSKQTSSCSTSVASVASPFVHVRAVSVLQKQVSIQSIRCWFSVNAAVLPHIKLASDAHLRARARLWAVGQADGAQQRCAQTHFGVESWQVSFGGVQKPQDLGHNFLIASAYLFRVQKRFSRSLNMINWSAYNMAFFCWC